MDSFALAFMWLWRANNGT